MISAALFFFAAVSFYGPNHDIKEKQMEADDKITEYIARLHSGNTLSDANVFLIGSYDKSRYIELTGNDFRYYEVHENKGTGTMSQVMKFSCPKDDPSYKDELLKYCDMIPSKIALSNMAELSDHIKDKVWIHSNRPEKNLNQEKISYMEKDMVELVDGMVRQKTDRGSMTRNELFNQKLLQKRMDEYFTEVRKVMDAIGQKGTDENNLVPEGYQKEDMDKLRQMIHDSGLSPDAYKKSMQFLEKIKPEIHKAKSPFELRREKEERQGEDR